MSNTSSQLRSLAVCIMVSCLCAAAFAQPAGQATGAELEKTPGEPIRSGKDLSTFRDINVELKLSFEHAFDAGIDNSPGDLSISRLGGQIGLSGPLFEHMRWNFEAAAEASWYDFSNASGLVPGTSDPLNDVIQITLTPSLLYQYNEHWAFLGGAIIQFAGESDADLGDSVTAGGFFGTRWKISDNFTLQLGVAVKTRLEENLGVLPLLGFDWRINDSTHLATEGAGLKLSTSLNSQWSVFLKGGWNLREYRLDDDNALPDGVFRDQRGTVSLGTVWSPTERFSLELVGGMVVWNELRFDNSNGIEVAEENTDPTGFLGFTGTLYF